MCPVHNNEFSRCAEVIDLADALLVTAGAGIGVDSGLPDFRGSEGFWRVYPSQQFVFFALRHKMTHP